MSSFPQFASLPTELQLHIWYFALEVQEGHIVSSRDLEYGQPRKFKPHVLYFVNCNARRTYLKFHKKNLARYPRMGTVVFDPRIDTVLLLAGRPFQINYGLMEISNGMTSSVMKDVRHFAIGGFYPYQNFDGGISESTVFQIARVLPSVRYISYVAAYGDVHEYSLKRPIIGLATTLQGDRSEHSQSLHDLLNPLVKATRDGLEKIKQREKPDWSIPRVQAMFAIFQEAS